MKKWFGIILILPVLISYLAPLNVKALHNDLISNENSLTLARKTDYKIYPVSLKTKEEKDSLNIINVVIEKNFNPYIVDHIKQILKDNRVAYNISNEIKENKINLLIGINNNKGIVNRYFQEINYNTAILLQKELRCVIDINNDKKIIAIMGNEDFRILDGLTTLEQTKVTLIAETVTESSVNARFDQVANIVKCLSFIKEDRYLLEDLINKASKLNKVDYVTETWSELVEALTNARSVFNNDNVTVDEVSLAYATLNMALANLVAKPDNPIIPVVPVNFVLPNSLGINPMIKAESVKIGDSTSFMTTVVLSVSLANMAYILLDREKKY